MPDIVLVPTAVLPGEGSQYTTGVAGVTLQAGDVCYLDVATQKYALADSSDVARARVRGIASHAASAGQPVRLQSGGAINFSTPVLSIGELYCLSGVTPGKIAPYGDLAGGDVVVVLGVAQSTSVLTMKVWNTELARVA